jgi:hypothetical protein
MALSAWGCRYGLPDGRDMLSHHIATLGLILASYLFDLTRPGRQYLSAHNLRTNEFERGEGSWCEGKGEKGEVPRLVYHSVSVSVTAMALCSFQPSQYTSAMDQGQACACFPVAGVLVLALMGLSNPLLHASKIVNQLRAPSKMRTACFASFAAVFFLSRCQGYTSFIFNDKKCMLFPGWCPSYSIPSPQRSPPPPTLRVIGMPLLVLRLTAIKSLQQLDYGVVDFPAIYIVLNITVLALYGLQLNWMARIWRVLVLAMSGSTEQASSLSAQVRAVLLLFETESVHAGLHCACHWACRQA